MPKKATNLLAMPDTRYRGEVRLITWYPRGILDDFLADSIIDFIAAEEQAIGSAFNRYADLTRLERVNISLEHVFDVARDRKRTYDGPPVKTAIFAVRLITLTIARMYQELMEESAIEVGIFRVRNAAAEWLGVPEQILSFADESPS